MDEIILSSREFKALASPTRAGIIKLLQERNHTMSEISKKLNLKAPTVKQHLDILAETGLISPIESSNKWKYYSLTKKGKLIFVKRESTNILVMLAVTLVALAAVIYPVISSMAMFSYGTGRNGLQAAAPAIEKAAEGGTTFLPTTPPEFMVYEFTAIALIAIMVFLVYRLVKIRKQSR